MHKIKINGVEIKYSQNNVRILNSYKITKPKEMEDILLDFKIKAKYLYKRSIESWITEWKAHNRLYKLGLYRSHTVDCDLEENEKLHRLIIYQIIGI